MDAPKRNPDTLNTIGIVTVGGVGSALVYLSIVGLQAFYVNDTSKVDELARFGTQAEVRQTLRGEQLGNITDTRSKGVVGPSNTPVYSIPIEDAKRLIVRDAKIDPANLVPAVGRSEKSLIQPAFGRPIPLAAPAAPAVDPATGVAPATDGAAPPAADAAATGGATPTPAASATGGATPTTAAPAAGGATPTPAAPAAGAAGAAPSPVPPSAAPPPAAPPAGHQGSH